MRRCGIDRADRTVWVRVHFENHPDYARLAGDAQVGNPEEVLLDRVFKRCAEKLVLLCPGSMFRPLHASSEPEHVGYFRLSYSMATRDELARAIATFAEVLRSEFRV